jgi:arylsulfatase A-like enzyme
VIGNNEYRPALSARTRVMTADLEMIRKADGLTGNKYLAVPTLAETLHGHGMRTVVAGAKTVALIPDRGTRGPDGLGVDLFAGDILPKALAGTLKAQLGKFPTGRRSTGSDRDLWTTKALVGPLWDSGVPPFSMLWLSQPDASQHGTCPGSPEALAAIKSSDANLGRVLAALKEKHLSDETDVIIVSDHGFSTIIDITDIAASLNAKGFSASYDFKRGAPQKGRIFVVSNSGSVFFYVIGHDGELIAKLVHFLQGQPYSGVLLTREPVEGAFPLDAVKIKSAFAPDVVLAMGWRSEKASNGTPGLIHCGPSEYRPGQGTHGSLSPFDLHNTCVAAGPDFARGFADEVPTGNVDIVPTALWILGVEPKEKLSGRVLTEAMTGEVKGSPTATKNHLGVAYQGKDFQWKQFLDYSEVEGVRYLEQGNGEVQGVNGNVGSR